MKKTSVVLVFDIGTQSTRALLVSSEGKILAKAQKGHHPAYVSRKSGWAEQDPDFYYQNLCRVSRQLRESFPDIFAQIRAVTLTTIRCTSVCLGRDGEPLRPAILWLDQRRASGTPALKPWISAAVKAGQISWRKGGGPGKAQKGILACVCSKRELKQHCLIWLELGRSKGRETALARPNHRGGNVTKCDGLFYWSRDAVGTGNDACQVGIKV